MRGSAYVRYRYRLVLSYVGLVLALCGVLMLTPLTATLGQSPENGEIAAFILPALIMVVLGLCGRLLLRPVASETLTVQEGGVIVVLSWFIVCLFSAWPFAALCDLNCTQAIFESVSGWTTTGLSVVDVTRASSSILLWRSIMQLAGGAGLAIIMLSAIIGPAGPALGVAEGREQLVPHVRRSSKLVLSIYSGYVVLGILALHLAGMQWVDAVNHAFAALSTGGFSTRPGSIGDWNSTAIEAVTIPLMLLGNLSFVTAWLLLRGKARAFGRNGEIRLMALLLPVCALLVFLLTTNSLYASLGRSVRVAVFETVSALTTTGFSTVGYGDWNSFGWVMLVLLMMIGGGTCSTAGGMKQYRVYLLWKSLLWGIRRDILPRSAVTEESVWEGEERLFVSDGRLRRVGMFVFLYLSTLALGTLVLAAHGYGLKESLFEYASALGTVGLSVGVTSPSAPGGVLWAEIAGMMLGRLEFMVILTGVIKLVRDFGRR